MRLLIFWLAVYALGCLRTQVASNTDVHLSPMPLFTDVDSDGDGCISIHEYQIMSQAVLRRSSRAYETLVRTEESEQGDLSISVSKQPRPGSTFTWLTVPASSASRMAQQRRRVDEHLSANKTRLTQLSTRAVLSSRAPGIKASFKRLAFGKANEELPSTSLSLGPREQLSSNGSSDRERVAGAPRVLKANSEEYTGCNTNFVQSEECSWLSATTEDNVMRCNDGFGCNVVEHEESWSCCISHGDRAKCPANFPYMCGRSTGCARSTDYCCLEYPCPATQRPCFRGCTDLEGSEEAGEWSDSELHACEDYYLLAYCDESGGYGSGWNSSFPGKVFQDFAVDGKSAADVCCACGGGSYAPPPPPPEPPLAPISPPPPPLPPPLPPAPPVISNGSSAIIDVATYAAHQLDGALQDPAIEVIYLRTHVVLSASLQKIRHSVSIYGECDVVNGNSTRCRISGELVYSMFIVVSGAALHLEGLELRESYTIGDGGAVFLTRSNASLVNCIIQDSQAIGDGGAVYGMDESHVSCVGCWIVGNSAGARGGAMWLYNGSSMVLDGASVLEGNKAQDLGTVGGELGVSIVVKNGTRILRNVVQNAGGGVGIIEESTLQLDTGSEIAENLAAAGGGLEMRSGSTAVLSAGSMVRGNFASTDGGGVRMTNGANILRLRSGSLVGGNMAEERGGGVMMVFPSSVISGGCSISGNRGRDGGALHISGSGSDVEFKNTTLCDNVAELSGGAAYITIPRSLVTFDGCRVCNNTALGGSGGGVNSNGTISIMRGSFVVQNSAGVSGGGLYGGIFSSIRVSASTVANNSALRGGGVYSASGGRLGLMDGSAVESNQAAIQGGGAFGSLGSILSVNDSSVSHNWVSSDLEEPDVGGGGVFLGTSAVISVGGGGVVRNNSAPQSAGGGGILAKAGCVLGLADARLSLNIGGQGGGVYLAGNSTLLLERTSVAQNSAMNGGGIYGEAAARVVVSDDSAVMWNMAMSVGGGIRSEHLSLHSSQVSNNTAGREGGGVRLGAYGELVNATVSFNEAGGGGGVYFAAPEGWSEAEPAMLLVAGSAIRSNFVSGSGGGITLVGASKNDPDHDALLRVESGTVIAANVADEYGGGLSILSRARLTISRSSVLENTASNGAGVYGVALCVMHVADGSRISANNAIVSGGGLFVGDSGVLEVAAGCRLDSNQCGVAGAAVLCASGSNVTISDSFVRGNRALREGGGIAMQSGAGPGSMTRMRLENSSVVGNTAVRYAGGGISSDPYCLVEIVRSHIIENIAGFMGGGLSGFDSRVELLSQSVVAYNHALNGGGIAMVGVSNLLLEDWPEGATLRVAGALIQGNFAETTGGGITVSSKARLIVEAGQVTDPANTAIPARSLEEEEAAAMRRDWCSHSVCVRGNAAPKGAAFYLDNSLPSAVEHALLELNGGADMTAESAVVAVVASEVAVRACRFERNVGPAVALWTGATASLRDTAVANHTALQGAALYVEGDSAAAAENCSFTHGLAVEGGAAFAAGNLTMTGSTFEANRASANGACLYLELDRQVRGSTASSLGCEMANVNRGFVSAKSRLLPPSHVSTARERLTRALLFPCAFSCVKSEEGPTLDFHMNAADASCGHRWPDGTLWINDII
ncbi:hypothetical protein CYMTET_22706 [Cymbomonas tetramitiformis]|uniref:Pectate lyase C n=1 Tax=Cymbomonas tetramitiformis TaxID=36881 RepID=A0AAE0FZD3_9CHLO|nr:hypothetical protein CYMTET_22706 [Cymbomonas tetramitiformis]